MAMAGLVYRSEGRSVARESLWAHYRERRSDLAEGDAIRRLSKTHFGPRFPLSRKTKTFKHNADESGRCVPVPQSMHKVASQERERQVPFIFVPMSAPAINAPRPSIPPNDPLLTLAPTYLPNHRRIRYKGDDLCGGLSTLAGRDQALLRHLYEVLTELLHVLTATSATDREKWREVAVLAERRELDAVIDAVREIDLASYEQHPGERFAQALHDVWGGALSPLLGRLQLLNHLPKGDAELRALFVLTRDHLKIMRSALVGLDDARRDTDRRPKTRDMRLVLDKWHDATACPQLLDEQPLRLGIALAGRSSPSQPELE